MRADNWRGLDFYKPAHDGRKVLIVGVGHTGSITTFGLARLGVKNITICDPDHVESHNLPNQFFSETLLKDYDEDTKKIYKVIALTKTIQMIIPVFNPTILTDKVEAVPQDILLGHDVVFFCVDDMDVRMWMFK